MKAGFRIVYVLLIVLWVCSSCSSLPGKKEIRTVDIRNKAAEYHKDGINQFNSGRYAQALDLFDLAYKLNASIDYEEGLAITLNSIGRTKLATGEKSVSLEAFTKALSVSERLNNIALIQTSKNNLAEYYLNEEDLINAYDILSEELADSDVSKSKENAKLAHTLSLVLRKQGKYDEALIYLNRSLKYNMKNDMYRGLAADYYMLASIYSLRSKYDEALNYALEALKNDKIIEFSHGIAADLEALSIISSKMGSKEDAEIYKMRAQTVLDAISTLNKIDDDNRVSDNTQVQ